MEKPYNKYVERQLYQAKAGKAHKFYQNIWDKFLAAGREEKAKMALDYPELWEVAKEPEFSAQRTQAMAEKAGRDFE